MDNTRAVDLGPNGNDITYNAYGNAQGTVEYVQTSALNYLAVNNVGRWDMRLELDTTGPVGHTMAMGCWIKLRHGSNGLDTIITTASGTMGYGTTEENGHFFGRGGNFIVEHRERSTILGSNWNPLARDTWSHSVIGSQKTIDYIKAQPDYENTWWCWQARLTAEGRVETSLDGSPFALAQNSHGDEDLATVDLINSNNKPALPVLHIGCDGYGDNRATNSYGAMFWYRDGEYTDEMAFESLQCLQGQVQVGNVRPAVRRPGDSWQLQGAVLAGAAPGDSFGAAVALKADGSVPAVGAPAAGAEAHTYWARADIAQCPCGRG